MQSKRIDQLGSQSGTCIIRESDAITLNQILILKMHACLSDFIHLSTLTDLRSLELKVSSP